jgi:hypothetical protein
VATAATDCRIDEAAGKERGGGWRRVFFSHSRRHIHTTVLFLCALFFLSSFPLPLSRRLREALQQEGPSAGRETASLASSPLWLPSSKATGYEETGVPRALENDLANNLWDDSTTIPPWMKRYFSWHRSERNKLTRENWQTKRYLVLRCLRTDYKCGGASDRLSALPYILMLANQTRRLLFIHWSRPAALEEFLIPPRGGMNWTVPDVVSFNLTGVKLILGNKLNVSYIVSEPANSYWVATDRTVVQARLRGTARAFGPPPVPIYDARRESPEEATFENVYGDMWRVMFEPSPPVKAMIQSTLNELGLETHKYVSAHVRSQYLKDTTGDTEAVKNALHCAASLQPNAPVYLASDSMDVTRFGLDYGRRVLNRTVVTVIRDDPPLHIDRGRDFFTENSNWDEYPPSAFYDTFVDLYLLSYGICTTSGIGSYGHWATMMSWNASCSVKHSKVACQSPTLVSS